MQAGIQFPLTIFPKPMAFLNPGKRPLHHPPLRHNCEGMKFIAFGNLYRRTQNFIHSLSKRASCIASIGQYVDDLAQQFLMPHKCSQYPFSICNVGCRHGKSMGESLCINGDMALDTRYFFTRIVAFGFGSIRVLYTLCVNDQKGAVFAPAMFDTGRANLIFFKACSSKLNSLSDAFSFHCLKYVYTVLLGGKSLGIMSHWQPLLSSYNIAQNTSYKSTWRGLVFFLTLNNKPSNFANFANCSRLMSLGHTFLISQIYAIISALAKRSRSGS